ncbi:MAG: sigma-70 family RNA polymerase sigma factor [Rickettsiales bacterium]|nr:sigma-70 family RNA polymerase sigma factor [Rickettsiales bacterium]
MQAWQDKDDTTLLEHLQQGSHHAFNTLVERHTMRFFRLAYRYVSQKEAAEDVTQRAFLKLWEKPSRWDASKGVKFTTWFSRIIINQSLDMQKKRTPLLLADGFEVADESGNQERGLIDAQQKVQLEHAIRQLPARQQTALNLCFYEEHSNGHAAEVMQVSVGAVESLLMRAKANLRLKLEEYEARMQA